MNLYYVWVPDSAADSGDREYIVKAKDANAAVYAVPLKPGEQRSEVGVLRLFKDKGTTVEAIGL